MADWHPIRVVARRTGLTPHVIRAWEKRYGAVSPKRTETNRRLYSNDDVERLALLRRATLAGRSIGQIARLDLEALKALVEEDEAAQRSAPVSPRPVPTKDDGEDIFARCVAAVESFDAPALRAALDRASVTMSRPALMETVIVPLMKRLGEAWREGQWRVAHEHMATAVVRSFAGNLNGAFHLAPTAPVVIVTTPAGQVHEIGALLAAATAASEGWRPTYLGPNLPAEEIASAVRSNNARAVALSIVYPTDDPYLNGELERLKQLVGPDVAVFAGGRGAASYRKTLDAAGIEEVVDLQGFRNALETLRAQTHN